VSPNLPASVHQRLLNNARATGRPLNEVLQRFALERFLYRVGHSPYASRFVLKGAMMLTAWRVPSARPTRDIDLLGHMENSVEQVVSAVEAICQEAVPDDGLRFDVASIVGERIVEAGNYSGVRVCFTAYLGNARIPMRIDVGFGDPLVPGPIGPVPGSAGDIPPDRVYGF
jgi:hypothetical protein